MTDMLVVQIEPGLPAYRLVGLFAAIRQHPGVKSVADIHFLTQETLDLMLMQPEPAPVKRKRRSKAA